MLLELICDTFVLDHCHRSEEFVVLRSLIHFMSKLNQVQFINSQDQAKIRHIFWSFI